MKIILANPRGFCAGVYMAIDVVDQLLDICPGETIYVYHEIVHNRHVVDRFRARGVKFIEDVAEAPIEHPHVVGLECRQPNIEGAGGVDLARLVREALRMRPDRLVVGECRGAEVREFLAALNTGHRGGAGTLHANSLIDVAARLEAIGLIAGLTPDALARQVLSGIDLVVHLARQLDGRRAVALGRFGLDARERLVVVPAEAGAG